MHTAMFENVGKVSYPRPWFRTGERGAAKNRFVTLDALPVAIQGFTASQVVKLMTCKAFSASTIFPRVHRSSSQLRSQSSQIVKPTSFAGSPPGGRGVAGGGEGAGGSHIKMTGVLVRNFRNTP